VCRALRFILIVIAGLAALAAGAAWIASRTMHRWSERDVALSSELAITGARQALVAAWRRDDGAGVQALLDEIARDERIMAAAACRADGGRVAVTHHYPAHLTCRELLERVRPDPGSTDAWRDWGTTLPLPGGAVHLSAQPLVDAGDALGFVVLAHDMRYAERREVSTRAPGRRSGCGRRCHATCAASG
jgi:hypothetical protein